MQWRTKQQLYEGSNTIIERIEHPLYDDCVLKRSGIVADQQLIATLPSLAHPHILFPLEVITLNGDLHEFYEYRTPNKLTTTNTPLHTARKHLIALAEATTYLHDHQIVHRDIRPANIFANNTLELFDFDHATRPGTPVNAILSSKKFPPEASRDGPVTYAFDTWQVGYIAERMTYKNNAYTRGRTPRKELTQQAQQIIQKAISENPQERYQHGAELLEALNEVAFTRP